MISEKLIEKVEENNKLIKKLYKGMIWRRVFRIIKVLIILGVAFGSFYFIQPYVQSMMETFGSVKSGVNEVKDIGDKIPDLSGMNGFLEQIGIGE